MNCAIYGLFIVLISAVVIDSSPKPASQAIQLRQLKRNRINGNGQRKIYIARQAAPINKNQQAEIYEEELPTAITATDFNEPSQILINPDDQQRFIGTGFGNIFANKQTLMSFLVSTSTTSSTTTVPPPLTGTGTITITPTVRTAPAPAPLNDPIAPSVAGLVQRQQPEYIQQQPIAYQVPIVIRRRGPGQRWRPLGGGGGQVFRFPVRINHGYN